MECLRDFFGSYLAQTLMRDHPEGIRSVVLDSVLPTAYTIPGNWWNARAGFDNLFHACAAETACNAGHPHLEAIPASGSHLC
jgi:pimeloyl-ACP methyl ester carboxylesterase